ncbi:hypothetical protein [Vibrio cholerae]|uniref:hypothetical protein n=1 Tax=Vibrio cholerae TaxID=666 RepID=UPI0004E31D4A|nr:hypothetical protein [Vibrio cholerae]EGR2118996.1 hypothetical protein [Vibrio cholerae]KFE28971.1 hypothetical protein DN30_583 [Vibrio cholerae]MBY4641943.1 hypothetical protein [Vibrio cholerae]MCR9658215.1 hypothetical protein [Vibrio cholerae]MCR9688896.1 hypothetical protein [Vibrio cholerae]
MAYLNSKSMDSTQRIAIALNESEVQVEFEQGIYKGCLKFEYIYAVKIDSGNTCELHLPMKIDLNDQFNILDYKEVPDYSNARLMFGMTRLKLDDSDNKLIYEFMEKNRYSMLQLPATTLMEIERKFAAHVMANKAKELHLLG